MSAPSVAKLALEDGSIFTGLSVGADGEASGEVVFNTAMTGYQEILTDPSYKGQIVTMTYPLQGNYGLNEQDVESRRAFCEGFIVRDPSPSASNYRSTEILRDYLARHRLVGLAGIDTRALTRRLRIRGSLRGVISTTTLNDGALAEKARRVPSMEGQDLARLVAATEPYPWTEGTPPLERPAVGTAPAARTAAEAAWNVVVLDFGVKRGILRSLVDTGCRVTVLPGASAAGDVLGLKPDGVVLSNGPGDPAAVAYGVRTIQGLLGKVPLFGICLGHQMLGLAAGGTTYKLKFGHHGANHPVRHVPTGRIQITSHNHGFAVDPESLAGTGLEVTHVNGNDGTVEGCRSTRLPAFSVQFHPEASPGPHDAAGLFEEFTALMKTAGGGPAPESRPRGARKSETRSPGTPTRSQG